MTERPICKQCESYRMQKAKGTVGWETVCVARSRKGRVIDWQFGLSSAWTKRELKDRMEIKICPAWCPKQRKEKTKP